MIWRIIENFRLRWPWIYDPDQGVWFRDDWLIEEGWRFEGAGYRLSNQSRGPLWPDTVHPTVRDAMLTAAAIDAQHDAWVFRSRKGDVRDTAAAMIPEED